MLYVQLDTNWPDHPKIIRAGIAGAGAHAIVMCLSKRNEADGWVDRLVLTARYGISDDLLEHLCQLDLLEFDGNRVRPDGWLDRNPSQAAIAAKRAAKAEAGRRGNHKKYGHDGSFEDCTICTPNPQVVAGSETEDSQSEAPPIADDRSLTKPEPYTQSWSAIAPDDNSDPAAKHTPEQKLSLIHGLGSVRGVLEHHTPGGAA